jgi:RimJ/RimL family protein N-acetyltransferase
MTESEFSRYLDQQLEDYTQDIARNFKRPIQDIRVEAKRQIDQLLKDGISTPDHFLFNVVEKKTETTVGEVWFHVDKDKRLGFLYSIQIGKAFRGKGFGKESLKLVESKLKELGVTKLGLHVFADNQAAINLYKTQGYDTTSFNMQKDL